MVFSDYFRCLGDLCALLPALSRFSADVSFGLFLIELNFAITSNAELRSGGFGVIECLLRGSL